MPDVDLDAIHRAQAEALGERPKFTLARKKYELVPELSVVGALAFTKIRLGTASYNDVRDFLSSALANEKDVDAVLEAGFLPSDADALVAAWSTEPGESSASSASSNGAGKPSRPTSKRTTPRSPRSRKPSGAKG